MSRLTLTYSAIKLFQSCRRKYNLRINECLAPIAQDDNLFLGSVWHSVLELWHSKKDHDSKIERANLLIDQSFPHHQSDTRQRRDWHLCHAMFKAYRDCYPEEDFDIISVEQEFSVPIINPATGRSSRTFELRGKVDGLVRMYGSNELLLMEHKTTSMISSDYIERLPGDFQVNLYCHALERSLNQPITGAIYNCVQKAALRQSEGETEEQFQIRRAELISKSKQGRSSAKRRLPESDEEFRTRLTEKYRDPSMFHREVLYLSRQDTDRTQREIWEITKLILAAKRENTWTPNWDNCFRFGNQPCMYWPLCRSDCNPNLANNYYEYVPPHGELSEVTEDPDTADRIF